MVVDQVEFWRLAGWLQQQHHLFFSTSCCLRVLLAFELLNEYYAARLKKIKDMAPQTKGYTRIHRVQVYINAKLALETFKNQIMGCNMGCMGIWELGRIKKEFLHLDRRGASTGGQAAWHFAVGLRVDS